MNDSSSENSDNEKSIPTKEICEERSKEFASLTETDSAQAFFYLQKHDWCLERAVDVYFADRDKEGKADKSKEKVKEVWDASVRSIRKPPSVATSVPSGPESRARPATSSSNAGSSPHRVRVLSWNIDGLDSRSLKPRVKSIAETLAQEKPDVVYLQEVTEPIQALLEELCPSFNFITGTDNIDYYTVIMLHCETVDYISHSTVSFPSSMMGRSLLTCKAKVKSTEMELMTSHLESTADHVAERVKQLKMLLKQMRAAPSGSTVLAGGDLNLRDKEVKEIGDLPNGIYDLWEVTGKRKEARYTWDTHFNHNKGFESKWRPRLRFDRLFMRHPTENDPKLKPVYFELVGLQKAKQCDIFPSDHWGILAHFDIVG